MKIWLIRIFFGLLILIVLGLFMLYQKQERLIFAATQLPKEHRFDFDIPFEEVYLETSDSITLHGIHFKTETPKGVILYFHGNAGDVSRWGDVASYFTIHNYDVVVMDYRTYGKSQGKINEKKMLSDTQLWYDYLLKDYNEETIVVYGRSIGTSFATYTASRNTPKKLILETPFYDLADVAGAHYRFIPKLDNLLKIKLKTHQFMKTVKAPVVIYHGTNDGVVDYQSGQRLAAIIPDSQLTFITIKNGAHNNLITFSGYQDTIGESLE